MSNSPKDTSQKPCCHRGGARPGCGRKPGVPTRPVRLPEWLLDELDVLEGDSRALIIKACIQTYGLKCSTFKSGEKDD